jgi:hypothetical protein
MTKQYNRNDSSSGDKWVEKGEQNLLRRGEDDGNKPARDISTKEFKQSCDPWDEDTWKPGALPHRGDSKPRFGPSGDFGTHPVKAASPTGKYGKPGGKGQRSGA